MSKFTWTQIQKQSDKILSCGLHKLRSRPLSELSAVTERGFGNYLISLDKVPFYIGEAKGLKNRLNQQFKPTTSTFYKNYEMFALANQLVKQIAIDEFEIQLIATYIGRKEVEEFGIVNLPTKLNKFQLDKRKDIVIADQYGLWDMVQENFSELLKEGECEILKSNFSFWYDTKITSHPGLYLVKDKSDNLIYIGESSNLKKRILTHSERTYFSALRRHIGTEIFNYNLQEVKGKKRYFSDKEDEIITAFLKTCTMAVFPVAFGRYELEEYLIRKYKPLLNRKGNKG